jgi:phospholipid/cholesterol/gamma-HCH transport system substrate-binding protein
MAGLLGLDRRTTGDLIRLVVFAVVTTLFTGVLVMTIGNVSFGDKVEYKAQFVDATGVVPGDDVRVSGVKVGTVEGVEIVSGDRARVTFAVAENTRVDAGTHATIRYRNLVGQRYISLTQEGSGERLAEGGEIPVARTSPALDLTVLFNGFKPLFEALSPDDINRLSYEVVQVFQGEGGTVESLLASTASVTSTLARRDQLIGDLLENLDYVLDHVADREEQLTDLITSFRTLVGGLKSDRRAILDSLDGISDLSVETAGLVQGLRAPLVADIKELRTVAGNIDRNKAELDRVLQVLPIKLNKLGRTTEYGSWTNMYLCHFKADVTIEGRSLIPPVNYATNGKGSRCDLG